MKRRTLPFSDTVLRRVYDSPAPLSERYQWLTPAEEVHKAEMIAQVILGEQKFVNTEAPRAIAELKRFQCKSPIDNLRSFKCHNWAYAKPALLKVIEQMSVKLLPG